MGGAGGKGGKSGRKNKPAKSHPNSHAREVALQGLYQLELGAQTLERVEELGWLNEPLTPEKAEFCLHRVRAVDARAALLDAQIAAHSDKHITQISVINRCILRMAIHELSEGLTDPRIVMDDALNLTRKYDGDEAVSFVNGILDAYFRQQASGSTAPPD